MTDASPLPAGDPKSLGLDPERLSRIGPAMQAFVDDRRVPNLITLVARRGQLVHLDARGLLDFDTGAPATADTLCRMYSNSKPVTSVATMILFERGVLTPDDPVSKFLPEFADSRVRVASDPMSTEPAKRPITIRDCIANTTSFTDPATMPSFYRQQYGDALRTLGWMSREDDAPTPDNRERVRALAGIPLAAHPGERFVYHMGYPVLGAILAEVCGQPLDAFYRENIFEPLGMVDTDFYLKDGALDRFGACYVPREENGEVRLVVAEKAETSEKHLGPRTEFGVGGDSGGILSTAGDYARFGQMLLNGGELDGVRIIGRKTVDMMLGDHTVELATPFDPGSHWGLGVSVYHGRGGFPLMRSAGTYGWGGAAGTNYFADPQEELLCVCLTQVLSAGTMPNNNYAETFNRLVYQALK
ncbi:MAG: serine hydrolase [Gammaproteobacteria bacterium]|nr:serine hydrolase [Gammaproteobacteria bacterium]